MKILLTVHQFPPKYISGTEVLTYSVARELMSRGHEVRVLTGAPGSEPLRDAERFDEYEIDGIRVYRFTHAFVPMGDQSVIMEMEYCNRLVARYFKSIVDSYQPDLVHVFHMSRLGVGMIDVALQQKIPTYFTPTDFWSVCPTSLLMLDDGSPCVGPDGAGGNCVRHVAMRARWSWIADAAKYSPNILANGVVSLAKKGLLPARMPFGREIGALGRRHDFIQSRLNALNAIVSPTSLMTDALVRNGIDRQLIHQYMYGINIANYDGVFRALMPGAALRVGFIGGLMKHKGCHLLIKAISEMSDRDVSLKIYGNANDFPAYYEQLVSDAGGNPKIEFCGTFPNSKIPEILSGIDVLVVPSIWFENAPLVIHSALAARCPVVASDFPGMSEVVIHQKNGLLFAPGSVSALKAAIERLLNEVGLLAMLSTNCQPPKGIETYVAELLDVYSTTSGARKEARLVSPVDVSPFDPSSEMHFVSGWATVEFAAPRSLSLLSQNGDSAVTCSFSPRSDVRKGLMQGGDRVRGDAFGFRLAFPVGVKKEGASVELVSAQGRKVSFSLANVACGQTIKVEDGCYFGLDDERFSD